MIKVISEIRRCGKSFFLKSIIQELLEKVIDEKIIDDDFKYLFIDEIQKERKNTT